MLQQKSANELLGMLDHHAEGQIQSKQAQDAYLYTETKGDGDGEENYQTAVRFEHKSQTRHIGIEEVEKILTELGFLSQNRTSMAASIDSVKEDKSRKSFLENSRQKLKNILEGNDTVDEKLELLKLWQYLQKLQAENDIRLYNTPNSVILDQSKLAENRYKNNHYHTNVDAFDLAVIQSERLRGNKSNTNSSAGLKENYFTQNHVDSANDTGTE